MSNIIEIPAKKLDPVQEYITEVKGIMNAIESNYIMLGYKLIFAKQYYNEIINPTTNKFCKNIYEFAELEFGLKKSSTKNYIAVASRFSENGIILEQFKDYNFTQLTEMLPLNEEQLKLCSSSMTAQEIRALRKSLTGQLTGQNEEETTENIESTKESRVIKLKNDNERREFLENHRMWRILGQIDELGLKVFVCEIENGDFIYAYSQKCIGELSGYSSFFTFYSPNNNDVNYCRTNIRSLVRYSVNQLIEYFKKFKVNPLEG